MKKMNLKDNLEYHIYIKKDYEMSITIFEDEFSHFVETLSNNKKFNKKHKCDRNENCECVKLGKYLIDIYAYFYKNTNLIKVLEKYFYNPSYNIPYPLLKYLSDNMIKLLDYQNVQVLIENYLMYSKIKSDNLNKETNLYEISLDQYVALNEILIFDVILVTGGFNRAKGKIMSLKVENVKEHFLSKYNYLLKQYSIHTDENNLLKLNNDNIPNIYENIIERKHEGNLFNKLCKVLENKIFTKFEFINKFSSFKIKNSFLQKIINLILNKNFLIFVITFILLAVLRKVIKRKEIDLKLKIIIAKLAVYLNKFKCYRAIRYFFNGFFQLLVNY